MSSLIQPPAAGHLLLLTPPRVSIPGGSPALHRIGWVLVQSFGGGFEEFFKGLFGC